MSFTALRAWFRQSPPTARPRGLSLPLQLMAPALNLMRRVRMSHKVALVSLLFGLPLLALSLMEFQSVHAAERAAQLRLDTLQTLTTLQTLMAEATSGQPAAQERFAASEPLWQSLRQAGWHPDARTSQSLARQLEQARQRQVGDWYTARGDLRELLASVSTWFLSLELAYELDESSTLLAVYEVGALRIELSSLQYAQRHHEPPMAVAEALGRARQQLERVEVMRAHAGGLPDLPLTRQWLQQAGQRIAASMNGAPDEGRELWPPEDYQRAAAELPALRLASHAQVIQGLNAQLAELRQHSRVLLVGLGLALLLSTYLGAAFLITTVSGQRAIQRQIDQMAEGDFSGRIQVRGSDESAQTLAAINASFAELGDLLATVQKGADAIHHSAAQLAAGNTELSTRNRRTTQGLQDVVDGVARYAQQLEACGRQVEAVAGTVQALRLDAASNRKQMGRLQERMSELQRQSGEIGEIVELIDGIAFRTNILALNASIEASKAGEAGRGFAVVAKEVRALAMRSAESSRRIGEIVMRSTEDIALASALADETGRVLGGADRHVDGIHQAIHDVAELTRGGEQESAAILAEVRALSEVTERNTTLVEQLAQAGLSLQQEGASLNDRVHRFKLP